MSIPAQDKDSAPANKRLQYNIVPESKHFGVKSMDNVGVIYVKEVCVINRCIFLLVSLTSTNKYKQKLICLESVETIPHWLNR